MKTTSIVLAATLALLTPAGSAFADRYELRVTGTSEAFLGFPAVPVVCALVYDTAQTPVTQVIANVTTSTYAIESYSLTFDGAAIAVAQTPVIRITNTVPGAFGNPDEFNITGALTGDFAGLPLQRFVTYAFDYGLNAIDNTALPTDAAYFDAFTGGNGGLLVQLDFTSSVGNAATTLVDPVVTITLLADCAADWNTDGALNSQDFFEFLTDFFAADADFNADKVTNSQDLFDFLAVFFVGC